MGRGKSNRGQRDTSDIASSELLAPLKLRPIVLLPQPVFKALDEVSDRRRFSPHKYAPSLSVSGTVAPHKKVVGRKFERIGFNEPKTALACVRRVVRRQVMFALGKRGKGSRSIRRKLTPWSKFKC